MPWPPPPAPGPDIPAGGSRPTIQADYQPDIYPRFNQPNAEELSGLTRINPTLYPYLADPTGQRDATDALTQAALVGAVDVPPGVYSIAGLLDIPGGFDFTATAPGAVIFKLGPGGLPRVGNGGGAKAGRIGGFEIDGQGLAVGNGLHVAGRNQFDFYDMYIHGCLGADTLIDGGQNHNWWNCQWGTPGGNEVSIVFDHATGGHNFYGCEIAGGVRTQQTHVDWTGGYPTWVGPSDIHFHGGRSEFPLSGHPCFYLAAGGNISLNGHGCAGGIVLEPGAQNFPLKVTNILSWDGAFNITVADASGLTALMSAKVPNTLVECVVNNVVGNVVTLSIAPTADPSGGTAQFGARMLDFTFIGPNGLSGPGNGIAIDQRGATTVTLIGRPVIQGWDVGFSQRHSDQAYLNGYPKVQTVATFAQQQAGDVGAWSPDVNIATVLDSLTIKPRVSTDRAVWAYGFGDNNPFAVLSKAGGLALGDGTFFPQNAALTYLNDSIGDWLQVPATARGFSAQNLRVVGEGGFSTAVRSRGQRGAAGPPTTGTHQTGDELIDTNGIRWFCLAGGTPGTWVAQSVVPWRVSSPFIPPPAVVTQGVWLVGLDNTLFLAIHAFNNGHALNDSAAWKVNLSPGTWRLDLAVGKASSYGITTIDFSADDGATWTNIGSTDLYAAAAASAIVPFTNVVIPRSTTGYILIRFTVTSKNASSTNYYTSLSSMEWTRTV